MVEDRPEEIEPSPDSGRAKRAPPTIDLEATEISGETQNAQVRRAGAAPAADSAQAGRFHRLHCRGHGCGRCRAGDRRRSGCWDGPRFRKLSFRSPTRRRSMRLRPGLPQSRPRSRGLRPPRPIRRWPAGSTRWKNPSPRCVAISPACARNRRNSRPISRTSNRRRANPPPQSTCPGSTRASPSLSRLPARRVRRPRKGTQSRPTILVAAPHCGGGLARRHGPDR